MREKWILIGVVAVVVAGIGWVISSRKGAENAEPSKTFTVTERNSVDQALVDSVLEYPERMDRPVVAEAAALSSEASVVPTCTLPTGKDRQLLSDVKKPAAPQPLKEPVAADSLHFRKDYASLRTDAVRNPNSPENRAGVVSLMQARQRRLEQK